MGHYIKRFPADVDKLMKELKNRGVNSLTEACIEMGRAHNYISEQAKRGGGLSESTVKFLKLRYNIEPESYAPDKVEESKAAEPVQMRVEDVAVPAGFDYDRLGKVIYDAVYGAVKAAWLSDWKGE